MRFAIITALTLSLATSTAAQTIESMEATRLIQALDDAEAMTINTGRIRPNHIQRCYVALDTIEKNSSAEDTIMPLGYGNTGALSSLAEQLELVCNLGFRSQLENYGLMFLIEQANKSTTKDGRPLNAYLEGAKNFHASD